MSLLFFVLGKNMRDYYRPCSAEHNVRTPAAGWIDISSLLGVLSRQQRQLSAPGSRWNQCKQSGGGGELEGPAVQQSVDIFPLRGRRAPR